MDHVGAQQPPHQHEHIFLGEGHEANERKTWVVIALCGLMMALEIVGGLLFGSIALVADGLHMSTHAGALLLAALAYSYARKLAHDRRFTFGTGKLGDLAGFTSAIVLLMIAMLIGYEAVSRLILPVGIDFNQAIPIACLGLAVNIASAWLLSGGEHHHHAFGHAHDHRHHDAEQLVKTTEGALLVSIFEDGVPPRFRIRAQCGHLPADSAVTIETVRPGGEREVFAMAARGGYLESLKEVAEPHAFQAHVRTASAVGEPPLPFEEHRHAHGLAQRDNNMRAAVIHVMADAAVSMLVIVGLVLGRWLGWVWMDPVAGLLGAVVIVSWSYALMRDTAAILLDMNPDPKMSDHVREAIEGQGDRLTDLHVWRLGPGHLGAIVSVVTARARNSDHYRACLAHLRSLSHVTVEVRHSANTQ